jgi:NAD(P)-dependent dehydrogenase (short-subunit alcohol dehydrogenase family)
MSGFDAFRYDGKRVPVVGGATGMGAAAAKTAGALGAEVVVMDHAPVDYDVVEAIKVDLRDRAAIDDALGQVTGPLAAVFSAAGVADGTEGLMKINFIGHRHIIETLVSDGRLGRGGAVCLISSVAGLGWETNLPTLTDFLATPDYESAVAWLDTHPGNDHYFFSKQVMSSYVARSAHDFLLKGVRINAICPGPTDTPLARANADLWLSFSDNWRKSTGTDYLTPDEMADVMVFLNSRAANGISGVTLLVDAGHVMSSLSGTFPADEELVKIIAGRTAMPEM